MAIDNFREKEREAAALKAKQRKRRRRKKQAAVILVLILLISMVTLVVLSLTVFFKTAEIKIEGSKTYTAEEIISAAEISIGDNLFLLSESKISERLQKQLPFIDEVKLERVLPETLKITVSETKEEICFLKGTDIFSANKKGKVIKEYTALPENMIWVTVSDDTKLSAGSMVSFVSEREADLFDSFFKMVDEYDFDVNFINISDPYDSYMKLENRLIIKFGSGSYFENKAAYLKAGLGGVSENATGVFDLSGWTPENNQPVLTYGDISAYEK